jgi:hypothetical protein
MLLRSSESRAQKPVLERTEPFWHTKCHNTALMLIGKLCLICQIKLKKIFNLPRDSFTPSLGYSPSPLSEVLLISVQRVRFKQFCPSSLPIQIVETENQMAA